MSELPEDRQRDEEPGGTDELFPLVYDAIHDLARRRMARERQGHTLQATALVNEVYLRLCGDDARWSNRRHFLGAAAEAMRRILIEHARRRLSAKHGKGIEPEPLDDPELPIITDHGLGDDELLSLHEALTALDVESPRHALVVKLKYFVGMTADEIAESLEISAPTVKRDWSTARTWLHVRMSGGDSAST